MRAWRALRFFMALAALSAVCPQGDAQAALLMEEPYGFFGALNPTGTMRCTLSAFAPQPYQAAPVRGGRARHVFTRYQGIAGYDWWQCR